MEHEARHPVTRAKFIVTPGEELDKVVFEGDARTSIRGGEVSVLKFHRRQPGPYFRDVLQGALQYLRHHFLDIIILNVFLQETGQVHY